ncbi:myelin-oligodendrocyte glycoprotein-like [Chaetodon trifascialis]|uniref:myelin-oligodendrocyte glycoprotein-like n=1 Tax=Chaetodon trifascialis TaxID=109706 RepID=UPI003993F8A7
MCGGFSALGESPVTLSLRASGWQLSTSDSSQLAEATTTCSMDLMELSDSLSPPTLRWTIVVVFLLYCHTSAEGQFQVIGSGQPIVAAPGDDVILPCLVEPRLNVAGLTVEWSKPDPRNRPGPVEYVHVYRHAREDADMMSSTYIRRTELFADGLRQGNASLKILNVTLADRGRYRCNLPKLGGDSHASVVHLVVDPNAAKASTTEPPLQPVSLQTPDPTEETSRSRLILAVVPSVLLILGVGVAAYTRWKCRKQELVKLVI